MKPYTAEEIADFIVDNYDRAAIWHRPVLNRWINWMMGQGFCLLAGDEELLGMVLVRPTMEPQNCVGNIDFDPEGDCYFIDMAIAKSPKRRVLQALGFSLLKRFGQRDKIAFQRHGLGPVIVTDAHHHRKQLMRALSHKTQ